MMSKQVKMKMLEKDATLGSIGKKLGFTRQYVFNVLDKDSKLNTSKRGLIKGIAKILKVTEEDLISLVKGKELCSKTKLKLKR